MSDRLGVIAGLKASNGANGHAMARLMRDCMVKPGET